MQTVPALCYRLSQKKMDVGREASKVPSELGGLDTDILFFSEASKSSKTRDEAKAGLTYSGAADPQAPARPWPPR
jgi:hypothetical protein